MLNRLRNSSHLVLRILFEMPFSPLSWDDWKGVRSMNPEFRERTSWRLYSEVFAFPIYILLLPTWMITLMEKYWKCGWSSSLSKMATRIPCNPGILCFWRPFMSTPFTVKTSNHPKGAWSLLLWRSSLLFLLLKLYSFMCLSSPWCYLYHMKIQLTCVRTCTSPHCELYGEGSHVLFNFFYPEELVWPICIIC